MCADTMDGTHILVIAPPTDHDDFVDLKGYHIILMQTVVDYEMIYEIWWTADVKSSETMILAVMNAILAIA